MRAIVNLLTASRILCSIALFCFVPLSVPFLALYLTCGLSDVLDGYLARKTNTASTFGAVFDSIADAVFFVVILVLFLSRFHVPAWALCWILVIALIRLCSLGIGWFRFHAVAPLHTLGNKLTGLMLFAAPLLYLLMGLRFTAILLGTLASLSALEELFLNLTATALIRDVKGIFLK